MNSTIFDHHRGSHGYQSASIRFGQQFPGKIPTAAGNHSQAGAQDVGRPDRPDRGNPEDGGFSREREQDARV